MAHFAKLNSSNVVVGIDVVNNEVITDENGVEQEQLGIDFLTQLYGGIIRYKQTSYNTRGGKHYAPSSDEEDGGTPFRKNYAGAGYTYDASRDAFIAPQPYINWTLNETTCKWEPPVAYPDDGKKYKWDEDTTSWKEIE